jgi:hypothetical protein
MDLRIFAAAAIVAALGAAGCTSTTVEGADAKSAADAAGALQAGTKVCISDLAGVRYALEDALREQKLEPARSCTTAKIRLQESGARGAWIMRYQRVGDRDWKECRSAESERHAFAEQCIGQMMSDLGG